MQLNLLDEQDVTVDGEFGPPAPHLIISPSPALVLSRCPGDSPRPFQRRVPAGVLRQEDFRCVAERPDDGPCSGRGEIDVPKGEAGRRAGDSPGQNGTKLMDLFAII